MVKAKTIEHPIMEQRHGWDTIRRRVHFWHQSTMQRPLPESLPTNNAALVTAIIDRTAHDPEPRRLKLDGPVEIVAHHVEPGRA